MIAFAPGANAEAGMLAAIKIERWPTESQPAGGTVTQILGRADEPKVRLAATLAQKEIDTKFPDSVEREAAKFGQDPTPLIYRSRS